MHAFLGAAPIPAIATLAAPVRTRIAREVAEALQAYVDGDGLASVDANVAVAYRQHTSRRLRRARSRRRVLQNGGLPPACASSGQWLPGVQRSSASSERPLIKRMCGHQTRRGIQSLVAYRVLGIRAGVSALSLMPRSIRRIIAKSPNSMRRTAATASIGLVQPRAA